MHSSTISGPAARAFPTRLRTGDSVDRGGAAADAQNNASTPTGNGTGDAENAE
jgi:hypothetical protein